MDEQKRVYAGVDVAKAKLDVAIMGENTTYIHTNTKKGIGELITQLRTKEVTTVVLEATGGYERLLVSQLHEEKMGVAVVNAKRVRHFAKATGRNAKTDRLDAQLLAEFGRSCQIMPQEPLTKEESDLREQSERRIQLGEMLTQERNRLGRATDKQLRSITDHIAWLESEIDNIDDEIAVTTGNAPDLEQRIAIADSIPGIGPVTSVQIIAHTPELGKANSKQASSLIGVAPFSRDSGTSNGRRFCTGGRERVRQALFLSALGAIRCKDMNPAKSIYQRLLKAGRPKMVAIVAAMHKLVTILNTLLHNQTYYDPVKAGFP